MNKVKSLLLRQVLVGSAGWEALLQCAGSFPASLRKSRLHCLADPQSEKKEVQNPQRELQGRGSSPSQQMGVKLGSCASLEASF